MTSHGPSLASRCAPARLCLAQNGRCLIDEMACGTKRHYEPNHSNRMAFVEAGYRLHRECCGSERLALDMRVREKPVQENLLHCKGFVQRRVALVGHDQPHISAIVARLQPQVPSENYRVFPHCNGNNAAFVSIQDDQQGERA